jgi:hypothetical protein
MLASGKFTVTAAWQSKDNKAVSGMDEVYVG